MKKRLLYKYMPYRKKFFENQLIRIPSRFSLNDPFEFLPSVRFVSELYLKTNNHRLGKTRYEIEKNIQDMGSQPDWMHVEGPLGRLGIMSLSKSNDNILMWSHYADQHSGVVIGFDPLNDFFNKTYLGDESGFEGKLHEVRYRKSRVTKFKKFQDPLLAKSLDWKYEAEVRFFVNLSNANYNLITCCNNNDPKTRIEISGIATNKFDDEMLQITSCDFPGSLACNANVLCMFAIPKKAIQYVGIGYRCNNESEIIKLVRENIGRHVTIEKYQLDNFKFKLKIKNIT